jgi:hypothetical protein
MGLFLFRFWPVLIPLLVYVLWFEIVGRKAVKAGQAKPLFREGPWYWLVISMLGTALACFVLLGASIENHQGKYTPPHMENGVMVPGIVEKSK